MKGEARGQAPDNVDDSAGRSGPPAAPPPAAATESPLAALDRLVDAAVRVAWPDGVPPPGAARAAALDAAAVWGPEPAPAMPEFDAAADRIGELLDQGLDTDLVAGLGRAHEQGGRPPFELIREAIAHDAELGFVRDSEGRPRIARLYAAPFVVQRGDRTATWPDELVPEALFTMKASGLVHPDADVALLPVMPALSQLLAVPWSGWRQLLRDTVAAMASGGPELPALDDLAPPVASALPAFVRLALFAVVDESGELQGTDDDVDEEGLSAPMRTWLEGFEPLLRAACGRDVALLDAEPLDDALHEALSVEDDMRLQALVESVGSARARPHARLGWRVVDGQVRLLVGLRPGADARPAAAVELLAVPRLEHPDAMAERVAEVLRRHGAARVDPPGPTPGV